VVRYWCATFRIIGRAFNHAESAATIPSAQCEMVALRQAALRTGHYTACRTTNALRDPLDPAPMCAGLAVHSRIQPACLRRQPNPAPARYQAGTGAGPALADHHVQVEGGVLQRSAGSAEGFFSGLNGEGKVSYVLFPGPHRHSRERGNPFDPSRPKQINPALNPLRYLLQNPRSMYFSASALGHLPMRLVTHWSISW